MSDGSAWAASLSAIAALGSMIAAGLTAWVTYSAPQKAAELAEKLRREAMADERKLDCLRRFVAYRFELTSPNFLAAINEIIVTFNNRPQIIAAWTFSTKHGEKKRIQLCCA